MQYLAEFDRYQSWSKLKYFSDQIRTHRALDDCRIFLKALKEYATKVN